MSDFTFTNGSRIFTPQKPPAPPELGDVNGDGEIDILDAADVTSIALTDLNNDGVIDILDAAEFLAQGPGGIEIISVTNPKPPVEDPFDVQKCCDEKYSNDYWGFNSNYSNRQNSKRCYQFKDSISKISTCLPCNSTPLEEAVCKACATIPDDSKTDGQYGSRLVTIYLGGTEPTNPAVKLGQGKATIEQDGVTYSAWCSQIIYRLCTKCPPDPNIPESLQDVTWQAAGTGYCPAGFSSQEECMYFWFKEDYPYQALQSPEQYNGPYIGTFIWNPGNAGHTHMCKCADMTQDYDPCRYGATIQQCIEENGGSIDPGPSIPD